MNEGIGVMLGYLGGNEETVSGVNSALNKTIKKVEITGNELLFEFTDGGRLRMWDDGQSCCETRYMSTEDDLSYYSGTVLLGFEIKEAPSVSTEYEEHDVQFLEVKTNAGVFQLANHNEHNGYYGGFCIVARHDAAQ